MVLGERAKPGRITLYSQFAEKSSHEGPGIKALSVVIELPVMVKALILTVTRRHAKHLGHEGHLMHVTQPHKAIIFFLDP